MEASRAVEVSNLDGTNRSRTTGSPTASALRPPRILLETMTSWVARVLFLISLAAFVCGFAIDLAASLNSFQSAGRSIHTTSSCSDMIDITGNNMTYLVNANNSLAGRLPRADWSCTSTVDQNTVLWVAQITSLENVVAFYLEAVQRNISMVDSCSILDTSYSGSGGTYQVEATVYVCEKSLGSCSTEHWMLSLMSMSDTIPLESILDLRSRTASALLIDKTFQSQPSLVSKGIVRSYLVYLKTIFRCIRKNLFHSQCRFLFPFRSYFSSQNFY